jgi:hypothetical protein
MDLELTLRHFDPSLRPTGEAPIMGRRRAGHRQFRKNNNKRRPICQEIVDFSVGPSLRDRALSPLSGTAQANPSAESPINS